MAVIVRSKKRGLIYHHIKHIENYGYISISMGACDPYIIFFKLLGLKTCRVWIGTDVYKACHIWHYKLRAKFTNLFVSENIAEARWLRDELQSIGIKSRVPKNQFACICRLREEN